jgi:hypothetical protein
MVFSLMGAACWDVVAARDYSESTGGRLSNRNCTAAQDFSPPRHVASEKSARALDHYLITTDQPRGASALMRMAWMLAPHLSPSYY